MKKLSCLLLLLPLVHFVSTAQVSVQHLLVENLSNPIGLDVKQPRLSWQLVSDKRNISQKSYEIKVYTASNGKGLLWSSGTVSTGESVQVPYSGTALSSGKKYYWQVRVVDNSGKLTAWSAPAYWQMGLLNVSDWKAKWIQPGYMEDPVTKASPLFRKEFIAEKK